MRGLLRPAAAPPAGAVGLVARIAAFLRAGDAQFRSSRPGISACTPWLGPMVIRTGGCARRTSGGRHVSHGCSRGSSHGRLGSAIVAHTGRTGTESGLVLVHPAGRPYTNRLRGLIRRAGASGGCWFCSWFLGTGVLNSHPCAHSFVKAHCMPLGSDVGHQFFTIASFQGAFARMSFSDCWAQLGHLISASKKKKEVKLFD